MLVFKEEVLPSPHQQFLQQSAGKQQGQDCGIEHHLWSISGTEKKRNMKLCRGKNTITAKNVHFSPDSL